MYGQWIFSYQIWINSIFKQGKKTLFISIIFIPTKIILIIEFILENIYNTIYSVIQRRAIHV